MHKKLIIGIAVVGVLSIGTVANALFNNEPVKQNQASVQMSEPSKEALVQSDTEQTVADTTEPVADTKPLVADTSQPEAEPTAGESQEPAFDAQLYAQGLLEQKAQEGIAMNAECFTKLMFESTGWNMTKPEVDQAFAKVLTYTSTCAAYAQYKATGNY